MAVVRIDLTRVSSLQLVLDGIVQHANDHTGVPQQRATWKRVNWQARKHIESTCRSVDCFRDYLASEICRRNTVP